MLKAVWILGMIICPHWAFSEDAAQPAGAEKAAAASDDVLVKSYVIEGNSRVPTSVIEALFHLNKYLQWPIPPEGVKVPRSELKEFLPRITALYNRIPKKSQWVKPVVYIPSKSIIGKEGQPLSFRDDKLRIVIVEKNVGDLREIDFWDGQNGYQLGWDESMIDESTAELVFFGKTLPVGRPPRPLIKIEEAGPVAPEDATVLISSYKLKGNKRIMEEFLQPFFHVYLGGAIPKKGLQIPPSRLLEFLETLAAIYRLKGYHNAAVYIPENTIKKDFPLKFKGDELKIVINEEPKKNFAPKSWAQAGWRPVYPPTVVATRSRQPGPAIKVKSFAIEGNTLISEKHFDFGLLESYIGGPIPPNGVYVSYSRIMELLNTVLAVYRLQGFRAVAAYIPQESIASASADKFAFKDDQLLVQVVEGRIRKFTTNYKPGTRYKPWRIPNWFKNLKARSIEKSREKAELEKEFEEIKTSAAAAKDNRTNGRMAVSDLAMASTPEFRAMQKTTEKGSGLRRRMGDGERGRHGDKETATEESLAGKGQGENEEEHSTSKDGPIKNQNPDASGTNGNSKLASNGNGNSKLKTHHFLPTKLQIFKRKGRRFWRGRKLKPKEGEPAEGEPSEPAIADADKEAKESRRVRWWKKRISKRPPIKTYEAVERRRLEDYIDFLERRPGRSVAAVVKRWDGPISPDEVGKDVALDLRVSDPDPFTLTLQTSNTGSASTDQLRAQFSLSHSNLLGRDDSFQMNIQGAGDDEILNNHAFFAAYDFPLWTPRLRVEIVGSISQFETVTGIGGSVNPFIGDGVFSSLELSWNFFQYKKWFFDIFQATIFQKSNTVNPFDIKSNINLLDGSAGLRIQQPNGKWPFSFTIGALHNFTEALSLTDDDQFEASRGSTLRGYTVYNARLQHTIPVFDWLSIHQVASFSFSPYRLINSRQTVIGGLNTVRGYREFELLGDRGTYVATEAILNLFSYRDTFYNTSRFSFKIDVIPGFIDYGAIWVNDPILGETLNPGVGSEFQDIYSFGTGLKLQFGSSVFGRMYWGYAMQDAGDVPEEDTQSGDSRFHFDLTIRF